MLDKTYVGSGVLEQDILLDLENFPGGGGHILGKWLIFRISGGE